MKAITLHQPWATLVAIGAKHYETRSWSTSYRGPLAIHAGKDDSELRFMAAYFAAEREPEKYPDLKHGLAWWFRKAMIESGRYGDHFKLGAALPRGVIVCTCELVAIHETYPLATLITTQEQVFGNWQGGRYAWQLDRVTFLDDPIPARGQQGLWDWDGNAAGRRPALDGGWNDGKQTTL